MGGQEGELGGEVGAPGRGLRGRHAAKELVHDGEHLLGLERLAEEPVGAEAQGKPLVRLLRVRRRVEDERDPSEPGVGSPLPAEDETVHDRHEDVGEDEIRRARRAASSASAPLAAETTSCPFPRSRTSRR